jgi:hypothetical protein
MAFGDFTYPEVFDRLGLTERPVVNLFGHVPPVPATDLLRKSLAANAPLASVVDTELSRASWLIGPVLADLWGRYAGQVGVYAGTSFPADPDAGLNGYSDFLIGRAPQRRAVTAPVVVIGESKTHSTLDGIGQCIAGMVGAQRFNLRAGRPVEIVYGCATTGSIWRFLRLTGTLVEHDLTEYQLADVDHILGILVHMVGPLPHPAAA